MLDGRAESIGVGGDEPGRRERDYERLSFAQERIWFWYKLYPKSVAFNVPIVRRCRGQLNIVMLIEALRDVVERHDVLRTVLCEVDGIPYQYLKEGFELPVPIVSICREELDTTCKEIAAKPFDLMNDPGIRCCLMSISEDDCVLEVVFHHMVADGWSLGIFLKEVSDGYSRRMSGNRLLAARSAYQYRDYVAEERRRAILNVGFEEQLEYWRGQLRGLARLELPTDHVRPGMPSHHGANVAVHLSAELVFRLRELAQREGVTLFMILLAGFQLVLGRWAGQEEVAVGTDVANRTRGELESLIGFFVNQLVLRTDLSGNPRVWELLKRVRQVCLGAYAHQDLPFEQLVEELNPERSLSHTPLFQVKLVLQNTPMPSVEVAGLSLEPIFLRGEGPQLDVLFSVWEENNALGGECVYATDLFSAETIERLLGHWQRLLEGMVADPERRIDELEMLSDEERQQVVEEWNRTEEIYAKKNVVELFEEQVEKSREATAVIFGEEQLSYEELNGRANQLAYHLQNLGVGPEIRVGLCVERSLEMVIGLLGILKAGGAYVPLDPEYPVERLAYMVEDAATPVLLTQSHLLDHLPSIWGQTVCLDRDWNDIAKLSRDNPSVTIDAENAAYIIYTSGSTGKPKGVIVEHKGLANLARVQARAFSITRGVSVLQFASISFDASVSEWMTALLTGAKLAIPVLDTKENCDLLAQLTSGPFDVITIPPPVLANVSLGRLAETRCLVVAGQACSKELVKEWSTGRAMLNAYGPTELTVCASISEPLGGDQFVPIGKPISNTRIYVLDKRRQPVPVGVSGELYIGGVGLARGYVNRPDLTAERFVPDPFSGRGERLYRTGDLGRWHAEGVLEFVGRVDEQVKIRGYRVEPGEVEAVLREHGEVQEAVVVAQDEESGQKRLVAYVVMAEGVVFSGGVLRSYLKERLPEYMVPSLFMELEHLPLTANGKVDRQKLSLLEAKSESKEYKAPRTATEELLCGIWAQVLGLERVGIEDSFFELGGHSLLATQAASQVRRLFGIDFELHRMFELTTVGELAPEVEALQRAGRVDTQPPLVRVEERDSFPLSYAQQRLWFIDQLEPGSTTYNIPMAMRLKGQLNKEVLKRALGEVIRRHEVLRTRIEMADGNGIQIIEPFVEPELGYVDLRELLDKAEQESRVKQYAETEVNQAFDLGHAPLLRLRLLELEEREYVLLLTLHHIVSDGWSTGVLIREVAALYAAYERAEESPLQEMEIQYADYAVWQRKWLQGEVLEEQLEYWRGQLRGLARLELPTDHVRPGMPSHHGANVAVHLSAELVFRLRELAQREGVTLFMILLAGFQLVLGRWAGQEEVAVGTPVANRTRGELESLIGFFVNQLVLRIDLSGNPRVWELLGRVRQVCLGAYAHQDLPFEQLVEELNPERSLSHTPLFQVMLGLQNTPMPSVEVAGLSLEPVDTIKNIAEFDLLLNLQETDREIAGIASYATDLFSAETIERLLGHWQRLLEGMVADPERRIDELEMLSDEERQQVVEEWNRTEEIYAKKNVVELFEEQVEKSREATAVIFGEEQLSYEELNGRANQLAYHLQNLGVGPEIRVGLCVERSLEMVIGLLGILKAGGAYVPLDPEYPVERLAYMVEDAATPVLLTQSHLLDHLPSIWGQTVCLDRDWNDIAKLSRDNPSVTIDAENAAYIIYTSGSTGKPKGVIVEHKGLANTVTYTSDVIDMGSKDVMPSLASFSFDISLFELFAPWAKGAKSLLMPRAEVVDVDALLKCVELATVLHAVPHLMWEIVKKRQTKHIDGGLGAQLRCLITGGDRVPPQLIQQMSASLSNQNLQIFYGPTETAIICANQRRCIYKQGSVPIGKPISNTRIYVLDKRRQPVPVGVSGELYIGGVGLARGYVNRPDLTAERFVPDPFSGRGERLYRTGDLGRWHAEGVLEFVGRVDEQVKIRGYRVEPGEVEAVLREHGEVQEAVVVAQQDEESGQKRLVAYVVMAEGVVFSGGVLRSYLKERLPEYMVPSLFMELEHLPLTANGKVDRQKLSLLEAKSESKEYKAPRTATEELLCGIWAQVLGLERVGIEDSFFELGGHSLLATQAASQVRRLFGIDFELHRMFELTTVGELAPEVEALQRAGRVDTQPPLVRVEERDSFPLSYAQQRLWFIDQLEPGSTTYNIPMAMRLKGQLNKEVLKRALGEVIRRHEVLRTRIEMADGNGIQIIEPFVEPELGYVDLRELLDKAEQESRVKQYAETEVNQAFDLGHAPLLRLRLLELEEREYVLLLTLHHIVSDGWSTGVLIREVAALYAAYERAEESPLQEMEIQYADYAVWQRKWLQGEVLEEQLEYWRGQLRGLARLELPTDHVRPGMPSHHGANVAVHLSAELVFRLRELAQREGVTLFMILLAGFQLVLGRWAGQEEVAVGTDVANRTRGELESLIGFFVNQLVLRTDLSGNPRVWELLKRVRQVCLGAYAHQDLPFEQLVEELNPERSLSHTPLFQVKLVLQNTPMPSVEVAGLSLEPVDTIKNIAEFDLLLNLQETDREIAGIANYATDLFSAETIERLLGHWQRLLEGMVADPERRIDELEMLSDEERQQVVEEWNRTEEIYAKKNVVELFEEQVEKSREATAVIFGEEQLSYEELNGRANQLAYHLQNLGVGPEIRVGLCVERSLEMVIGLLGILKAGGAYVPLDPEYPVERLAYMVEDAATPVLLTQSHLLDHLPSIWGQTVCLDRDWNDIAKLSRDNPSVTIDAENAAYIIYTSGSTGKPKGVIVEHKGLANLTSAQKKRFSYFPTDRWLQFASIAFDASIWEWGIGLTIGATIQIRPKHANLMGEELSDWIARGKFQVLTLPPSVLSKLLPRSFTALQLLVVAGEACSKELVKEWSTGRAMLNAYGPTELTVCASISEPLGGDQFVPIGKPISNTRIYVLDKRRQPVPVGVSGELYIGGVGLARGYVNRPDLTAERFVPDPFSGRGERLYRTGDLGRWHAEGVLEFVGRVDEQVKIRGYRVEPGEVEAVLREHGEVQEAVVVAQQDEESGQKRLVAYVVMAEGVVFSGGVLRSYLKERLPEYMVPSLFMELEHLPLTANGKVDRQKLSLLEAKSESKEYKAPRTATEELLCGIWAQVLGLERVGIEDNFFELGGDSISSIQVAVKAKHAGIELDIQQVFKLQTISEIACSISDSNAADPHITLPDGVIPLLPIQQWFFQQASDEPWHFNQSLLLRVPPYLSIQNVHNILNILIASHDAFRLRYRQDLHGVWYQEYTHNSDDVIPLKRLDLSHLDSTSKLHALEAEAISLQRSLNLADGPLFCAGWFILADDDIRLLLISHHLVSDAVSWHILLEELQVLTRQAKAGSTLSLPRPSCSYGAWAISLQQYAQSAQLIEELPHWTQLSTCPVAQLPRDWKTGENLEATASLVSRVMDTDITARLIRASILWHGPRIQDIILAAVTRTITDWTHCDGMLIDIESHGREGVLQSLDVSKTTGWFTVKYPIYLQCANRDIYEDIDTIHKTLMRTPNNGIGYGVLRYLNKQSQAELGKVPEAEIGFNYLGYLDNLLSSTDWEFERRGKGVERSQRGARPYLISISSHIMDNSLHLVWEYNTQIHRKDTIEKLSDTCIAILEEIGSGVEGRKRKVDFPLAGLSHRELAEVMAEIEGGQDEAS